MAAASRKLIWVPIVHTQADLGSLGERFRQLYIERLGRERWGEHASAVDQLWANIGVELDQLGLDWSRVRLYQDGLPICEREAEIVREVAAGGSKNHQLLLGLMGRGALLTGTESPELLLQEYELMRSLAEARRRATHEYLQAKVLADRDRFIAGRIDATLEQGWTGLLFLGLLHAIGRYLPADLPLDRLDHLSPRGLSRPSFPHPGAEPPGPTTEST